MIDALFITVALEFESYLPNDDGVNSLLMADAEAVGEVAKFPTDHFDPRNNRMKSDAVWRMNGTTNSEEIIDEGNLSCGNRAAAGVDRRLRFQRDYAATIQCGSRTDAPAWPDHRL